MSPPPSPVLPGVLQAHASLAAERQFSERMMTALRMAKQQAAEATAAADAAERALGEEVALRQQLEVGWESRAQALQLPCPALTCPAVTAS